MEIFKDIPGYECLYQASNLGNIKSLERSVKHPKGGYKLIRERILKASINGSGYFIVTLCKNGSEKSYHVHQLIALSFLNHNTSISKKVINHKDFIRSNNNLENLELVTIRENTNKLHINSTSKYIGVYWDKESNKWRSKIWINGKNKNLGRFTNELDAHYAYQNALKNLNI